MKAWLMALMAVGVIFIGSCSVIGYGITVNNKAKTLIVAMDAKTLDNSSELDNMTKKITQTAQVSQKALDSLKEIIIGQATARTTDGGAVMKWIQESVPNVDISVMKNLQNIITSSRDSWTMRQKELIDMGREYNTMLVTFPSSMVLGFLGLHSTNVTVITSTRTSDSFKTGKDDNVNVFN